MDRFVGSKKPLRLVKSREGGEESQNNLNKPINTGHNIQKMFSVNVWLLHTLWFLFEFALVKWK